MAAARLKIAGFAFLWVLVAAAFVRGPSLLALVCAFFIGGALWMLVASFSVDDPDDIGLSAADLEKKKER